MNGSVNPLRQLEALGQSIWLDYIRRRLLSSPEFRKLIEEDGLKGMTSNPTIFEKAIEGSDDYDGQLRGLALAGESVEKTYEELTLEDIRSAADALRPLYDASGGRHGFVSYEVSPLLANDTAGTVAAGRRYFSELGRPNVLIKVPATAAGLPAITELIAEGVNVNVTLMFSLRHYQDVAEAYIRGLERRAGNGGALERVASVASVFVSRVDTLVDKRLQERLKAPADEGIAALLGKAAVANAKIIYQSFKEIFSGPRFKALAAKGARPQLPLWASTGTKNHAYSDVKYVEELIGSDTINTMPPATMDAFRSHGKARLALGENVEEAREVVARLAAAGIDLNAVGEELQVEGVRLFADSFRELEGAIAKRSAEVRADGEDRQRVSAPAYRGQIEATLKKLEAEQFVSRLWRKDPTLWKREPEHQRIIANALGWLGVAELMAERADDLARFANDVRAAGFRDAVVLGMGGSSLCPELFARTFASQSGYPRLTVLDSTVPDTIARLQARIDPRTTLFIVSTKSGGTVETLSFYRYFYEQVRAVLGESAGRNFVAITDAGTSLEAIARERNFRHAFLNPHDIGGRYSALSYFGLVPAALMGMDLHALLGAAARMAQACASCVGAEANPAVKLGAVLAALKQAGRDKVTFIVSPPIAAFGLWVEQLIAESTGKEGTGLVPVVGEPVGARESYGADRLFVYLRLGTGADAEQDRAVEALEAAGTPVVQVAVEALTDLGQEFMRWEIATATAGALLGIDAFDQPNVQESKDNTGRLLHEFESSGKLSSPSPAARDGQVALYLAPGTAKTLSGTGDFAGTLGRFLALGRPGDYVAVMAYVGESSEIEREIAALRVLVRDRLKLATTFGYGPRFLHSTGQLHKGGPNSGLFIQITQEHDKPLPIPDEKYGFALLNTAQHLGDFQSLAAHGRRVVRLDLGRDPLGSLRKLREAMDRALGQAA